jgi:tetrahydromethanopterin S-methyltransferase subunit H
VILNFTRQDYSWRPTLPALARAEKLSSEGRSEIARKAARFRQFIDTVKFAEVVPAGVETPR